MRDQERTFASPEDERVYRLEQRLRETEALVKGLTEEVLDLKSVTNKLYRAFEARIEAERAAEKERAARVVIEEPAPVIEVAKPSIEAKKSVRVRKEPEPVEEDEDQSGMDLIMQPDGTLKRERRTGSSYIIAPSKYQAPAGLGDDRRKGSRKGRETKSSSVIIAEDDDDSITR
ncbi:hypothetical protein [Methanofollis fontis]|nr:hypothetical protein [Methanofollis fontis]